MNYGLTAYDHLNTQRQCLSKPARVVSKTRAGVRTGYHNYYFLGALSEKMLF